MGFCLASDLTPKERIVPSPHLLGRGVLSLQARIWGESWNSSTCLSFPSGKYGHLGLAHPSSMTVFPEESPKPLGPELEQGMLYLQGERKEKQPTWGVHRPGYWFHWAEP